MSDEMYVEIKDPTALELATEKELIMELARRNVAIVVGLAFRPRSGPGYRMLLDCYGNTKVASNIMRKIHDTIEEGDSEMSS